MIGRANIIFEEILAQQTYSRLKQVTKIYENVSEDVIRTPGGTSKYKKLVHQDME